MGCDTVKLFKKEQAEHISIHAPIVGCDMDIIDFECTEEISIHAPIVGCDS